MRRRFWDVVAENPHAPNLAIQALAQRYCEDAGFPPIQPTPYGKPNPSTEKELAELFRDTPDQSDSVKVQETYGALVDEVNKQYKLMPISIEPFDDDENPYATSKDMMDDIRDHQRLFVYDGGENHTLLTRRENFKFRAVHDFYGHASSGAEFGARGEFFSFESHAKMFSPLARHGLACETRAQNDFVNVLHAHLPVTERPYAPQKVIWIPTRFTTTPALQSAYRDYPKFFPPITNDNPRRR